MVHASVAKLIYNATSQTDYKQYNKHMNETLEDLTKRISALLPGNAKHIQDDIERNIRRLLQSTLSKMNLVTREEFEVQSAVLQRTREKLEQLERQVTKLTAGND